MCQCDLQFKIIQLDGFVSLHILNLHKITVKPVRTGKIRKGQVVNSQLFRQSDKKLKISQECVRKGVLFLFQTLRLCGGISFIHSFKNLISVFFVIDAQENEEISMTSWGGKSQSESRTDSQLSQVINESSEPVLRGLACFVTSTQTSNQFLNHSWNFISISQTFYCIILCHYAIKS